MGLGACPEFQEKLRGVMEAGPPNAGQRCIHALACGYISHPVRHFPRSGVGSAVGSAVGAKVAAAVSFTAASDSTVRSSSLIL